MVSNNHSLRFYEIYLQLRISIFEIQKKLHYEKITIYHFRAWRTSFH